MSAHHTPEEIRKGSRTRHRQATALVEYAPVFAEKIRKSRATSRQRFLQSRGAGRIRSSMTRAAR